MYALGIETPSSAAYVHMAGRTGRVGQAVGRGVVTSVLGSTDELRRLRSLVEGELSLRLLIAANDAATLEVEMRELGQPSGEGIGTFEMEEGSESGGGTDGDATDDLRRRLEDSFAMLDDDDDSGADGGNSSRAV